MKKIVVIHQPDFLPYIGFFHRLLYSNLYVILDDVQFVGSSRGLTNRDKIRTQQGEAWLTISVNKVSRNTKINNIKINYDVDWRSRNLNLIKQNYIKSQFFSEIYPVVEKLYSNNFVYMVDFNVSSIVMLMDFFGISVDMIYSSSLNATRAKSERLVELLTMVDATHYLSGVGAKAYHCNKPFEDANIEVMWQSFSHPEYSQLHKNFIPYLSSIDMLFNCGIEKSREILRSI